MKNKILYTSTVLLASMAVLMVVGATTGKSADDDQTPPTDSRGFVEKFCFDGLVNDMDVSDLANMYTEKTNDYFNEQILKIMKSATEGGQDLVAEVPSPSLEEYPTRGGGLCKNANGKETNDMTCRSIAVCNPVNTTDSPATHPFCIGVTLLGVPSTKFANYDYEGVKRISQLRYSYFCYKAALDLKRDALYDSTPQSILNKCNNPKLAAMMKDKTICRLNKQVIDEKDMEKKTKLQNKLYYEINKIQWWKSAGKSALSNATFTLTDAADSTAARIKFIDEEIARAKTALDQTLDAYSQLRSAWQMHVKYMDTFAELVKYRDHLVEIRKQTDAFPIRFIDATTTKCS